MRVYPQGIEGKKARREYIISLAYQLAHTGCYVNWLDIERHLQGQGYRKARQFLAGSSLRVDLDRRCNESRADREL